MRVWSMLVVLALAPVARAGNDSAKQLAQKVQAFYEKTHDLSADVSQAYAYKAQHRVLRASGTMQLEKPGMMRWDVVKPYPKEYVIDGKALYVFDPDDDEVTVRKNFSADSLSAAVTFLWGKGSLTREFEVSVANRPELGPTVLELVPKSPESGFQRLFFAVDPATGMVQKSLVVDPEGNENELTFSNVKTNTGIPQSRFHFDIPPGATVTQG